MEFEKTEITSESIKETPFTMIFKENKVFLVMGNYMLTENPFNNKKECLEYVKKKPYMLIFTVAQILTNKLIEQNEFNKNKKND